MKKRCARNPKWTMPWPIMNEQKLKNPKMEFARVHVLYNHSGIFEDVG